MVFRFVTYFTIVLAIASVPLYWRLDHVFQLSKEINLEDAHFNSEPHCIKYSGIVGAEDTAAVDENILILSSADRMTLWETSGGLFEAQPGGLFVFYRTSSGQINLKPLILHNFPENDNFFPHGIYLSEKNGRQLLFVVNHAYLLGGERIDVFEVIRQNHIIPVAVQYLYSVGSEYFSGVAMGTLNDILVFEEGEFFVTNYLPFNDEITGRKSLDFPFRSFLKFLGNIFFAVFKIQGTYVRHCRYDANTREENRQVECSIVAKGSSYNGINRNQEKTAIFVSDPLEHEVHVYEVRRDGEPLQLLRKIPTGSSVDNIELDEKTNTLFLSSIYSVSAHMNRVKGVTSGNKEILNPGGALKLSYDFNKNSYQLKEIVYVRGEKLSSISVAHPFGDNLILLGSWEDKGVLLCPANFK